MTEEQIRELAKARVRTKLLIFRDETQLAYERKDFAPDIWKPAREITDLILSSEGIRLKADNQDLPDIFDNKTTAQFPVRKDAYTIQRDMLEEGWVKCLKKEE